MGDQQTIDPIEKLYGTLYKKGYYTKSLGEFKTKYSSPEAIDKLYEVVSRDGLYTKTKDDFSSQYFSTVPIKKKESSIVSAEISAGFGSGGKPINGKIPSGGLSDVSKTFKKNEKPFDFVLNEKSLHEGNNKINEIMYGDNWKDPVKEISKKVAGAKTFDEFNSLNAAAHLIRQSLAGDGFEAKKTLAETVLGQLGEDNQTTKMLRNRAAEYDKATQSLRDLRFGNDDNIDKPLGDTNFKDKLYSAAVKYYAEKNPAFKKQLEIAGVNMDFVTNGTPSLKGKTGVIMQEYLNDPEIHTFLEKENPNLIPAFEEVKRGLYTDNREFGINQVANKVSREVQKTGYNNIEPIFNFHDKGHEEMNNLVAKEVLSPEELKIWNENIKDNQAKYMDEPSLFEGIASGIKHTAGGIANTFTEPFKPVSETIKDNWEKEASHVSADPQGLMKYTRELGNTIGLLATIAATGNVTGLSNAASTVLAFGGDMLEQGKVKYPDSPVKAWTSAAINTTMYAALAADIFPKGKMAFAEIQPEVSTVIENLTAGNITREAARQELNTIGKKAIDLAGGTLKGGARVSAELTGIAAINQGLDKIMGLEAYNDFHPDDEIAKTLTSSFINFLPVVAVGKMGTMRQTNKLVEESLYEAASNPKRYERVINDLSVKDPTLSKEEMLGNLKFLTDTKKELDTRGISPKNQKRYLWEAMRDKAIAANKPEDSNLAKQYSENTKSSQEIKEGILNGLEPEDIVTTAEQKAQEDQDKKQTESQDAKDDIESLTKKNELDNKEIDIKIKELDKESPTYQVQKDKLELQRADKNTEHENKIKELSKEILPEGNEIQDNSVNTEREKEIATREKQFAPPDEKQTEINNFANDVRKYNELQNGHLGKDKPEGLKERNRLALLANKLGFSFSLDKRKYITTDAVITDKTNSNKAIDKTYKPVSERGEKFKWLWDKFKEIIDSGKADVESIIPNSITGADGKKMNKKQLANAMDDIHKDIPSKGANLLLNSIENMAERGYVEVRDGQDVRGVPIDEYLDYYHTAEKEVSDAPPDLDEINEILRQDAEENDNFNNFIPDEQAGNTSETPEAGTTTPTPDTATAEPGSKEPVENADTKSSEGTLSEKVNVAKAALSKAQKELKDAEDAFANQQAKQTDMFSGTQKGMFEADPAEIKSILDPLKKKVKEAEAELKKAEDAVANEADKANGDLFKPEIKVSDEVSKAVDNKPQTPVVETKGIFLSAAFKNKLKTLFRSDRGLPGMWAALKDLATGERQLAARGMRRIIHELEQAVKKEKFTDTKQISDALADTKGQAFSTLPDSIKQVVVKMRTMVDGYSESLVNNKLVSKDQADIINKNLGEYLNRSYKLYTDKKWIDKVPKDIYKDAIKFIAQQYVDGAASNKKFKGLTPDEVLNLATKLAEQDATDILTLKDTPKGQRYTEQFSKDLTTLKKREDIPEPIRKLMGEYTDPATQFAVTIAKLATLHSQAKLLKGLKDNFKDVLFFEKDDVRPEGYNYEVADDGSRAWNPLSGLFTSKIVIDALQEQADTAPAWYRLYQKGFGIVKKFKTIYSLPTQAVNFFANPFISLANGHFKLSQLGKSWNYYKDSMFNGERGQDEVIETLVKRNVIGQSVDLRMIRDMMKKDKADEFELEQMMKPKSSKWNPLNWIKNADRVAKKQYAASDAFWKVYGFMNEATSWADVMYQKKYKNLTADEKEQVDLKASERIKNTYPTYDRALPGLMAVGKNVPFIGNFMAFQAEVLRTVKNNIAYAYRDLKSDDPKIKMMGAKRMAGIVSYIALKQGINYLAVMASGHAVSSFWATAFGNDDEEDKRKSLDTFLPGFLETHNLMVEDKGNGVYSTIDLDRLDPYNLGWQTLNSLFVGTDGGVKRAASELVEPFVEFDMISKALSDINKNENQQGYSIYNEADDSYHQMMDKMAYIYRVIEPTTAKYFKRVEASDTPTKEALLSLLGGRSYDTDIKKVFAGKLRDAEGKLSSNNMFYYFDKGKEKTQQFRDNLKRTVTELHNYYINAIKLGASTNELDEIISKRFKMGARKPKLIKHMIMTGEITDEFLQGMYE